MIAVLDPGMSSTSRYIMAFAHCDLQVLSQPDEYLSELRSQQAFI